MAAAERIIGIDENGLGPRLGPMIVTGVRLRVDRDAVRDDGALRRIAESAGIGDSKAACAHGDMAGVEALVLAVLEVHLRVAPRTFTELHTRLCLDDDTEARRLCPAGETPRACFDDPIELPTFGAGPDADTRTAANELKTRGIALEAAQFVSVCARRLNLAKAGGRSRFDVDLDGMVRLIRALSRSAGGDVRASCGKVGGRKSYAAALEPLSPLVGVLDERPARSAYRVPSVGTVEFVMDGDATEPAIGLASLIGKYVRELSMLRINRYWTSTVSGVTPVSGYHDPVTARMIAATALARSEREIADDCFER